MIIDDADTVSTHDLTKRSTLTHTALSVHGRCFNSRPHEEVDTYLTSSLKGFKVSTHDLTKRSTSCRYSLVFFHHVSTHDLTKRSTRKILALFKDYKFQLTTSRRGRHLIHYNWASVYVFQLTTSRRGRCCSNRDSLPFWTFQLTTSRRGRQQFLRKKFSFQNHFLCSLHIIYSYYINTIFFSTLFLAKSSFFLVRIL